MKIIISVIIKEIQRVVIEKLAIDILGELTSRDIQMIILGMIVMLLIGELG